MPDTTAKGGDISGALLEDDVIASSKSVLNHTRSGSIVGFQQFFTPDPLALFIYNVITSYPTGTAFDLTAGNGSLLAPFYSDHETKTFGIEIDKDQVDASDKSEHPYDAIVGDIQKIAPIMRVLGMKFDHITYNPPFGLQWEDNKWGHASSTVLAWRYATEFLSESGRGAFICGLDRWNREVVPLTNYEPYATLTIDKIWPNVDLATTVIFFTLPTKAVIEHKPKPKTFHAHTLSDLTEDLANEIDEVRIDQGRSCYGINQFPQTETWDAVREEYNRRRSKNKNTPQFTITVRGGKIHLYLSAYTAIRLAKESNPERGFLESIHHQPTSYFALNAKDWKRVQALIDKDLITIDPDAKTMIDAAIANGRKIATPLYPVPDVMRLGFIENVDSILCKKTSKKKFVEGQSYTVECHTIDVETSERKPILHNGEWEQATITQKRKALEIKIGDHVFSETEKDIRLLMEYFELPDPGDIEKTNGPEIRHWLDIIMQIEKTYAFEHRTFQRDDLARILTKHGGLFSWEQGAGKTLGGLSFAEAVEIHNGRPTPALFITPQDLIPQWQRESEKFYHRKLIEIRTIADAREWATKLKHNTTTGLRFITYFEALSRNGRLQETLAPFTAGYTIEHIPQKEEWNYRTDKSTIHPAKTLRHEISSLSLCRNCQTDEYFKLGRCSHCGWNHRAKYVKPLYSHLTSTFKNGVIVIDEATKIKSGNSLMSLSVRGLRSKWKLAMTGTPIKNYISDAFWILWWALGNATPRFPYDYTGGSEKFLEDFGVIRETATKDTVRRKILPEVSNLSRLWRLLASSNIRRRMESLGETVQPCTYHPTRVPFGVEQLKMYRWWLDKKNFVHWFIETHPDSPLVKNNMVEKYAAALGQLAKLEFAATLPEAEPTRAYTTTPQYDKEFNEIPPPVISNMTPKTLKILELARHHTQIGEKVLILSDVQKTGAYLAQKLNEAGISALHIVDENGMTIGPKQRATIVKKFIENGCQVLCASIQALNLGHNLDVASVCILDGFPWDFATLDQGIKRIRRLTSKRPITVYPILVEGSIDERKWKLLTEKGESADLALDGHLSNRTEKFTDMEEILKELQAKGIHTTGKEVNESDLEAAWNAKESLPDVEIQQPEPAIESASDREYRIEQEQFTLF